MRQTATYAESGVVIRISINDGQASGHVVAATGSRTENSRGLPTKSQRVQPPNFQSPHRSYADSTKLVPQHAPASSPSQLWSIAVLQLSRYRAQGGARSSRELLPSQRSQYTIEERTPTALPYTGTMVPGDLSSERKSAWAAVLLYTDRRTRHQPVASQNELRNCLSWGVQLPVPLNALGTLLEPQDRIDLLLSPIWSPLVPQWPNLIPTRDLLYFGRFDVIRFPFTTDLLGVRALNIDAATL